MLNIITCEWLRLRKTVALAFFIHSLLLLVLTFFGLFNSEFIGLKMSIILFYGLCGFLFGLAQMKKYTQSSRWTYFINRPIHVKKVFGSLLISLFFFSSRAFSGGCLFWRFIFILFFFFVWFGYSP